MEADTPYEARVAEILRQLGIPANYGLVRKMPLQAEAVELVTVGVTEHGRELRLAPAAARAWGGLVAAAVQDGVALRLVSAFRSVEDQRQIIARKLAAGKSMDDILRVSAAPGYSEHHTGRAVDIATAGSRPLEEAFEQTDAFTWLEANAARYGFFLSYPRDNPHGIIYEPWHWAFWEQPVRSAKQ